jgi:hypothetical protein
MTKRVTHAALAAFIFGTVPLVILVDAPAAVAMPVDKPDKPNEPRGDGCIPVGVTKTPLGVYAIEDCHGQKYKTRMDK